MVTVLAVLAEGGMCSTRPTCPPAPSQWGGTSATRRGRAAERLRRSWKPMFAPRSGGGGASFVPRGQFQVRLRRAAVGRLLEGVADALAGQRLVPKARDDVQVGVEDLLPAHGAAV